MQYPMRTPPELPAHLLPVPEGYVYLGRGDTFEAPRRFDGYAIDDRPGDAWEASSIWNGGVEGYHYAAPADSEIIRLNFGPQDSVKDELLAALKTVLEIADKFLEEAQEAGREEFPASRITGMIAARNLISKAEAQ